MARLVVSAREGPCEKEALIAIVRTLVEDVDASLAFYEEALGFRLRFRSGPFAAIERGDLEIRISGPGTSARQAMPDGSVPEPGGWNRIVVEVEDLEAFVAGLRARGTSFRNEPLRGPGGTQVLIEDPSGNPVEIFQPRDPA